MGKVIVFNNLTLDGVMQAPGRLDEDRRDGFPYGGWAAPYAAMSSGEANGNMANVGGLLVGRRTYEIFYDFWPKQTDNNPFTGMLSNMQKYVVSKTLKEPLPWMNSTLLKDVQAVEKLKAESDKDLMVMGSGNLIHSLMKHNLVDLYVLMIHPLVLGTGHQLFGQGSDYATLKLIDAKPTPTGVVVTTYVPGEAKAK